jgi:hypothetical protein
VVEGAPIQDVGRKVELFIVNLKAEESAIHRSDDKIKLDVPALSATLLHYCARYYNSAENIV